MTPPPSRRYLALYLPLLAENSWRLRNPCLLREGELIVFAEMQANAMRLTAVSRAAAAAGIKPNLSLADSRARTPDLVVLDRDHESEAALLARIVAGCIRYTPMAAAEPPDGAILDITGCLTPYDTEAILADDLAARLGAGGIAVRLGLGATPEAARARARFGSIAGDLHALPVEALEADDDTTRALRRAGLKTIGALACRPRAMLAARFGALAVRLGRLLGEEDRHITPDRPLPPIARARRFAEPIGRVEDALACLGELLGEAAILLEERHHGGRRYEARLFRTDGAIAAIAVETGQPTRDPATLIRLFRERIDALSDPIDPGFGFDLVRLDIAIVEHLSLVQDDCIAPSRTGENISQLIDRLAARLGSHRIRRAAMRNTHIPEIAVSDADPQRASEWPLSAEGEPPVRPLQLLHPPQSVGVFHGLPAGPPRRFQWRQDTYEIAAWEGPERIATEWWRHRDHGGGSRDYYRVEDRSGRRFWLFRHNRQVADNYAPEWYLQGMFA